MLFWAVSVFQPSVNWSAIERDVARRDLVGKAGLVHALGQERGGVGVAGVALDADVVARRHLLQEGRGLGLADADVVEGDVEHARVFDEPVVGDDRDAGVLGVLEGRHGGILVLGQEHEDVRAAVDQRLDVRLLLCAVEPGVEGGVRAAAGLDGRLHVRLVRGGPARLLEVVPRHADVADARRSCATDHPGQAQRCDRLATTAMALAPARARLNEPMCSSSSFSTDHRGMIPSRPLRHGAGGVSRTIHGRGPCGPIDSACRPP